MTVLCQEYLVPPIIHDIATIKEESKELVIMIVFSQPILKICFKAQLRQITIPKWNTAIIMIEQSNQILVASNRRMWKTACSIRELIKFLVCEYRILASDETDLII